jgi:hypothetical protein
MKRNVNRPAVALATNTSGIRGVRARWRKPKYGRPVLGLDVRYKDEHGAPRCTTMPPTVEGLKRALALREQTEGAFINLNLPKALRTMVKAAPL